MGMGAYKRLFLVLLVGAAAVGAQEGKGEKSSMKKELPGVLNEITVELKRMQSIAEHLKDLTREALEENPELGMNRPPAKDKFVAVFDGGSTGTRLNIYRFDPKGINLKTHLFLKKEPGIHMLQPEEVILGLLRKGEEFLVQLGHPAKYDFPMVFNGTAGLRLLDESRRSQVLAEVRKALKKGTGRDDIEVRVIDGKEEGFYAWAALVFVTQAKKKIGIIDLGGGSAQVSFEVDNAHVYEDGIVHGKKKSVLSRSFLGMGLVSGLKEIRSKDKKGACGWGLPSFVLADCEAHVKLTLTEMLRERSNGGEVAPGLSQVNTVFVSSFISEILRSTVASKDLMTFQDIKNTLKLSCSSPSARSAYAKKHLSAIAALPPPQFSSAHKPDCVSVIYVVKFMESLGVGLFTPIKDTSKITTDISWSLGRALSIIE